MVTRWMARGLSGYLFLCCVGPGRADESVLDSMRAIYESSLKEILADVSRAESTGLAAYKRLLNDELDLLKQRGDLDGVVALRDELAGLDRSGTISDDPGQAAAHPSITSARTKFDSYTEKQREILDRKIMDLTALYCKHLEATKRKLLIADKVDEAVTVDAEINRVRQLPSVTAAEFGLAVNASEAPVPAVAPPEPVSKETPAKEYRFKRELSGQGSLGGGWTSLPINIQPGDKIDVTAHGSWTCPRESTPCGPEGYVYTSYYSTPDSSISSTTSYSSYSWRQTGVQEASAPYGALLLRIGRTGRIYKVGKALSMETSESGLLCLDANILTDRRFRHDCSGALNVEVVVTRP